MAALSKAREARYANSNRQRELYRERCRDDDGQIRIVIVWRAYPGLGLTYYSLEDGTPVHFEDDCVFTIVPTGEHLSRCEE